MSKVIETDCGNVTTLADDSVPNEVFVSESAKVKITEILKDESDGSFLRIGVYGGGCSGFQYKFGIHDVTEDDDVINEWDDGKVVVDAMSIEYMKGATLDYVKDLMSEHFSIDNPSATSSCGCGESFGA